MYTVTTLTILVFFYHLHIQLRDAFKKKKTSYKVTSSLLPFIPARPDLIVTSLKSDKVVFLGPPLRPPERVTIPVTVGGISGTLRIIISQTEGKQDINLS